METATPELTVIMERLQAVERQNRRVKMLAVAVGIFTSAVMSCGLLSSREEAYGDAITTKHITAETIVLSDSLIVKDAAGRTRIGIGFAEDGSVVIGINDMYNKGGLGLGMAPDGTSFLGGVDRNGQARIAIGTDASGTPVMSLLDASEDHRFVLGCSPSTGDAEMIFRNAGSSTPMLGLGVESPGGAKSVFLQERDTRGVIRAELGFDGRYDASYLAFYRNTGTLISGLPKLAREASDEVSPTNTLTGLELPRGFPKLR